MYVDDILHLYSHINIIPGRRYICSDIRNDEYVYIYKVRQKLNIFGCEISFSRYFARSTFLSLTKRTSRSPKRHQWTEKKTSKKWPLALPYSKPVSPIVNKHNVNRLWEYVHSICWNKQSIKKKKKETAYSSFYLKRYSFHWYTYLTLLPFEMVTRKHTRKNTYIHSLSLTHKSTHTHTHTQTHTHTHIYI